MTMIANRKKKLIITAVAVFVIIAVAVGVFYVYPKLEMGKSYSVIYLNTGEIYIGKLSYLSFPRFKLTDAYRLQTIKDPEDETKTNFQLVPLKESLYSPRELYLNPAQVVFYGPIGETSKASEALRNANR